ncbi:hypothetical protein SteCoe_5267 [Stentor coeruleus]|uniref:Uncharacterized protein n=1 Tax=Stentor coeruleus TaxID=5963 RepID=A0A1R2CSS6_9CILI|nr:hypothetical protein SteCoe_5267 [Stentor coeruleus]
MNNIGRFLGPNRSPTPLKMNEIKYSLERQSKTFMKVLKNKSSSYKRLQKMHINDTCLAFIHKIKENHFKSSKIKVINVPNSKIIESASIPILSPHKVDETCQRPSPFGRLRSTPDIKFRGTCQNHGNLESKQKYEIMIPRVYEENIDNQKTGEGKLQRWTKLTKKRNSDDKKNKKHEKVLRSQAIQVQYSDICGWETPN